MRYTAGLYSTGPRAVEASTEAQSVRFRRRRRHEQLSAPRYENSAHRRDMKFMIDVSTIEKTWQISSAVESLQVCRRALRQSARGRRSPHAHWSTPRQARPRSGLARPWRDLWRTANENAFINYHPVETASAPIASASRSRQTRRGRAKASSLARKTFTSPSSRSTSSDRS